MTKKLHLATTFYLFEVATATAKSTDGESLQMGTVMEEGDEFACCKMCSWGRSRAGARLHVVVDSGDWVHPRRKRDEHVARE